MPATALVSFPGCIIDWRLKRSELWLLRMPAFKTRTALIFMTQEIHSTSEGGRRENRKNELVDQGTRNGKEEDIRT